MVEIEKSEIGNYFPEFFRLKTDCKFHNCVHINEPGCAVKQALECGSVASSRYRSYLSIYNSEDKEIYR